MTTFDEITKPVAVAADGADGKGDNSRNNKTYEVIIDGSPFEISDPKPTGKDLLEVVGKKPCGYSIMKEITPEEQVNIRKDGAEHFTTVVKDKVTIFVDGNPVEVHWGATSVAEIKRLSGVRDGYELAQEVDGTLKLLANDGSVDIQGCEVFESTPPTGAAS